MKNFIRISIIVLFSIYTNLKAQNCLSIFKNEAALSYSSKKDAFTKEAKQLVLLSLDSLKPHDIKVINIPVMYSTKKAVKIRRKGDLNKDDFFCYLNAYSLSFDESIILNDTVVGIVIPSANPARKLEYLKALDNYRKTISEEIIRINPEIIFTIYNIPRCYWYVKDGELFVLANPNNVFKSYNVTDYWKDYLTEEQISFLYYKEVGL